MVYSMELFYEDAAVIVGVFLVGSFVEYWYHRLMHYPPAILKKNFQLGSVHTQHHKDNTADGIFLELSIYIGAGVPIMAAPFAFWPFRNATLWFVGSLCWLLLAAFSHQASHENPCLLFWMPMPVHYVHHKYNEQHHNFGMATDFWDRVFGTYCYHPYWCGEKELAMYNKYGVFDLKWRTDKSENELAKMSVVKAKK